MDPLSLHGRERVTEVSHRTSLRRELIVGLTVFGYYIVVNSLNWPGRSNTARAHARWLFSVERRLHINVEKSLNTWLNAHPALKVVANYEYAYTYILSAFILIFWLYARRPALYPWARNSFIVLNVIGVSCFALYPTTPPRLMPEFGFTDTVRNGHTVGSWGSPLVAHANQLAAMPSLHLAWALWVSVVLALISGGWRMQLLSAIHVAVTIGVVLATGNHYLLDGLAAVLLVSLSMRLTALFTDRPGVGNLAGLKPDGPVPAADRFFLYVETPADPQQVGGLVLLDLAGQQPPSRAEVIDVISAALPDLPRFGQRLASRAKWRRPHWAAAVGPLGTTTSASATFAVPPAASAEWPEYIRPSPKSNRRRWRGIAHYGGW